MSINSVNPTIHPVTALAAQGSRPYVPRVTHTDGADASRPAIGAADSHPHSVRRYAPAITRMQRTDGLASKLASPSAADPQTVRL